MHKFDMSGTFHTVSVQAGQAVTSAINQFKCSVSETI